MSLAVQWLWFHASNARGVRFISGWGIKILRSECCSPPKNKDIKNKVALPIKKEVKKTQKEGNSLSWWSLSIYSARSTMPHLPHCENKIIEHVTRLCTMCGLIRLYTTQGAIFLSRKIIGHYRTSRQMGMLFTYVFRILNTSCVFCYGECIAQLFNFCWYKSTIDFHILLYHFWWNLFLLVTLFQVIVLGFLA